MEGIRGTWRRMAGRNRLIALALPVAIVSATVGAVGGALSRPTGGLAGDAVASGSPGPIAQATVAALPPDPTLDPAAASASPEPSPSPTPAGADPLLGTDGRLTVLLLGSDYRPAHPGNRTDAIMVVSIDPSTGKAAGFSIPRDTVNFPLPGGGVYRPKVNGLYAYYQSRGSNGGVALSRAVSSAFGIEVDGYAFIGFSGVKSLIAAVGGVDVTLDKPYYDAEYWVTSSHRGWGLPAGTSHLGPTDALIFARSRKGDNDFGRARRQQILVLAALDKVRHRGLDKLPQLLKIASSSVRTNLPLDRAADVFDIAAATDISKVDRVVFGPRTYANGLSGTAFALDLAACRSWIEAHFPPIRPMGHWLGDDTAAATAASAVP